mmetsp:Transcript_6266/g.14471  ORF Transcript_6266/g.14471 Transcript_6266/m.14471 type:complete len:361 (-) Transcript_6266:417-1499(-)
MRPPGGSLAGGHVPKHRPAVDSDAAVMEPRHCALHLLSIRARRHEEGARQAARTRLVGVRHRNGGEVVGPCRVARCGPHLDESEHRAESLTLERLAVEGLVSGGAALDEQSLVVIVGLALPRRSADRASLLAVALSEACAPLLAARVVGRHRGLGLQLRRERGSEGLRLRPAAWQQHRLGREAVAAAVGLLGSGDGLGGVQQLLLRPLAARENHRRHAAELRGEAHRLARRLVECRPHRHGGRLGADQRDVTHKWVREQGSARGHARIEGLRKEPAPRQRLQQHSIRLHHERAERVVLDEHGIAVKEHAGEDLHQREETLIACCEHQRHRARGARHAAPPDSLCAAAPPDSVCGAERLRP